jgi:hypothetical protein
MSVVNRTKQKLLEMTVLRAEIIFFGAVAAGASAAPSGSDQSRERAREFQARLSFSQA